MMAPVLGSGSAPAWTSFVDIFMLFFLPAEIFFHSIPAGCKDA
jgi:hypothetical protein